MKLDNPLAAVCNVLHCLISTAALGVLSCLVLMFFIDAAYAGVTMGMENIAVYIAISLLLTLCYTDSSCDGDSVHIPAVERSCHPLGRCLPGPHIPPGQLTATL